MSADLTKCADSDTCADVRECVDLKECTDYDLDACATFNPLADSEERAKKLANRHLWKETCRNQPS